MHPSELFEQRPNVKELGLETEPNEPLPLPAGRSLLSPEHWLDVERVISEDSSSDIINHATALKDLDPSWVPTESQRHIVERSLHTLSGSRMDKESYDIRLGYTLEKMHDLDPNWPIPSESIARLKIDISEVSEPEYVLYMTQAAARLAKVESGYSVPPATWKKFEESLDFHIQEHLSKSVGFMASYMKQLRPDWIPPVEVIAALGRILQEAFEANDTHLLALAADRLKTVQPDWEPSADIWSKLLGAVYHAESEHSAITHVGLLTTLHHLRPEWRIPVSMWNFDVHEVLDNLKIPLDHRASIYQQLRELQKYIDPTDVQPDQPFPEIKSF